MSKIMDRFIVRASVAAVCGALLTLATSSAVQAADEVADSKAAQASSSEPSVADLTQPTNSVEVGVTSVNKDSYKFGEYNGLQKKGETLIGNVDMRGGGAYDSNDATRWRFNATDLGLETRNLSGEYGEQGKFRINFGYDELLRNRSDTYQTPYQGVGSNNLTLPSNWLQPVVPQSSASAINFRSLDPVAGTGSVISTAGVLTAPTAGNLTTLSNIRTADLPAFRNVNLYTKRSKYDAGFDYIIDSQWGFKAGFRHEHKDGYKPMGTVSSQVSEFSAVIPDPINQDTDQYDMSLNYSGADGSFLRAAYYGSVFKNNISSVTWQDVNDLTKSATMSSAPSNEFHQLSLTGGYNFSKTTKLVVDGSYARNTQNDAFLNAATAQNNQLPLGLPVTSLDGLVVTKALDLKLTAKPMKDLNLTGAYKYNNRANQTPVNTYFFQDANETKSGTNAFLAGQGSNLNMYANRPYSKKVNQLNFDADYLLTKGQWLKAGLDWQKIDRSCNGSWIDCADAATTKENTLRAEWRANVSEDVSGKIGYAYSKRTVGNYNENAFLALVPYANVIPTLGGGIGATQSAYSYMLANGLTGFGPLAGYALNTGDALIYSPSNNIVPQALYGSRNNINELIGMRRFNMADRNRDKLRSSVNWQANEKLSFQGGLDFNKDDYANSVYGLKEAKAWALNLDGTYAASEDLSATVFYTYEDQQSKSAGDAYGSNNNGTGSNSFVNLAGNTVVSGGCYATRALQNQNAKIDQCLNWSTDMRDKVDTLGITLKQKNLMAGKLDLVGDLVYTRARTNIGVSGGSYVNNPYALAGAPAVATAVFFIPTTALPEISTKTIELRLSGKYALDKSAAVRVSYIYQHTKAVDYAYDGMQYGTGTNYLPTSEQAPDYTAQAIGVSYIYSFK
jgi:MtrB/PioB family decaheme-associated outer membrane protein